jgi:hypothetical protein
MAPMASSIDLKELVYLRGKRNGNAGVQQQLLSQNQQNKRGAVVTYDDIMF